MIERRYLLLYTYKIFVYVSIAAVIYVFTAGLFTSPTLEDDSAEKPHLSFSLDTLTNSSHAYFKTERREILVIKTSDTYSVFWANDPIYGCRLEFAGDFIKPICIDIKYDLNGESNDKRHQLDSPDYSITQENLLLVY